MNEDKINFLIHIIYEQMQIIYIFINLDKILNKSVIYIDIKNNYIPKAKFLSDNYNNKNLFLNK